MRLLFVTTGLGTGGAERMLVKLLWALKSRGCECSVVSLLDSGTQGPVIREFGVTIHELHVNRAWGLVSAVWRLQEIARSFKPDVIQGWMYHGNLAACCAWLRIWRRPRLFWSVRQTFKGMKYEKAMTRLIIRACAAISRLPTHVIFNSQVSREQHEAIGFCSARTLVIPNGFDLGCFRPNSKARAQTRAELGIPSDTPVVGMVARDHPMKDHATFLCAAVRVKQQLASTIFVLAGPGVDRTNTRMLTMIKQFGLEDSVRLIGERKDTNTLYPAIDVLALSSAWGEAFPNVLGEAMACGIPCVATDVGETRQIIGNTGYVVSPSRPDELATKLLAVLSTESGNDVPLGDLARQRIQALYALEAIADSYQNVFAGESLGERLAQTTTRGPKNSASVRLG
jgi:glycosyltransferase involved in cell wall biosynthesis